MVLDTEGKCYRPGSQLVCQRCYAFVHRRSDANNKKPYALAWSRRAPGHANGNSKGIMHYAYIIHRRNDRNISTLLTQYLLVRMVMVVVSVNYWIKITTQGLPFSGLMRLGILSHKGVNSESFNVSRNDPSSSGPSALQPPRKSKSPGQKSCIRGVESSYNPVS